MKRVTGIGGIFFKANDPAKLQSWYAKHLGIVPRQDGSVSFAWGSDDAKVGHTIWAPFPSDTEYFAPSSAPFMINYRVENLDALLEQLHLEGVEIDPKRETGEFGKFAWIMDPEGNRIELWEPAAGW
ncbi:MAG: glyoxalase [Verrucomicrobiales bacterium]|nr:glyoxalase [Verrucomicrobiales bacterium]